MAFVYDPAVVVVDFSDPSMEGLELRTRRVSIDELLTIIRLQGGFLTSDPDDITALLAMFCDCSTGWNMARPDGTPIPLTREVVAQIDHEFMARMIAGWMVAVAGVSRPLGSGSTGGGLSPEPGSPGQEMEASLAEVMTVSP